jgi:hypothetical protein
LIHLLACGVDLTTHVTDIAELLVFEDLNDVILVGTSCAGMIVTGVAAGAPELTAADELAALLLRIGWRH